MNATEMLAHSQVPIKTALGIINLKRSLIGRLFGPIAKKKMIGDNPFEKNLPTVKEFIAVGKLNFDDERNKLIELIRTFSDSNEDSITKHPHPFFGNLTFEEWNKLMMKHLDHHLRQFGV